MPLKWLKTLSDRQFYSGFAEIMKHGLIKDAVFYEWLLDHMYEICDREPETLLEMVEKSSLIKSSAINGSYLCFRQINFCKHFFINSVDKIIVEVFGKSQLRAQNNGHSVLLSFFFCIFPAKHIFFQNRQEAVQGYWL